MILRENIQHSYMQGLLNVCRDVYGRDQPEIKGYQNPRGRERFKFAAIRNL